MSNTLNKTLNDCQKGILIEFKNVQLSLNDIYAVSFSIDGSTPSGTTLSLNPSGYSYKPNAGENNLYTTAIITGVDQSISSHLIKMSLVNSSGQNVYTDYLSVDCGALCVTQTPTLTPTSTPTVTPSITPSMTETPTTTPSNTATSSVTPTRTPTATITPTSTITPSFTPITPTPSPSQTETPLPQPVDFSVEFDKDIIDLECCSIPQLLTININGQPNVEYNYILSSIPQSNYVIFDNPSGTIYMSKSKISLYSNVLVTSDEEEVLVKCRVFDQFNITESMAVIKCNNTNKSV